MDEGDFEAEEPSVRLLVDQLDALLGETLQLAPKVAYLVGDVVHPRPAIREELSNGRLVAKRREQLDPAIAHANRRCFHSLCGNDVAMLDLCAEEPLVCVDGVIEILDRHTEMMNPHRVHARGS